MSGRATALPSQARSAALEFPPWRHRRPEPRPPSGAPSSPINNPSPRHACAGRFSCAQRASLAIRRLLYVGEIARIPPRHILPGRLVREARRIAIALAGRDARHAVVLVGVHKEDERIA